MEMGSQSKKVGKGTTGQRSLWNRRGPDPFTFTLGLRGSLRPERYWGIKCETKNQGEHSTNPIRTTHSLNKHKAPTVPSDSSTRPAFNQINGAHWLGSEPKHSPWLTAIIPPVQHARHLNNGQQLTPNPKLGYIWVIHNNESVYVCYKHVGCLLHKCCLGI